MVRVSSELYRGSRPESFSALHKAGFKTVINLQSGWHEALNDDQYEDEVASAFGMTELNIPCSDFLPPTMKQWRAVYDAIRRSPGKTYIHCLHGKDRTGFMCAMYRMRVEGWSFEDAKREMYDFGFHKVPYLYWVPFLRMMKRKGFND